MIKKNILITGSSSRFCKFLKKDLVNQNAIFADKKIFNILNLKQMENFVRKKKNKIFNSHSWPFKTNATS